MNYLLDVGETFHYAALQIFGCLDPRALFRCRRVSHAFKKLSDQVIDARRIRSGKLFEQNRLLHGVPKHHGVWEMHNYSEPPSSIVCRDSWTLVTFPKNPQEEDPPNYQDMTLKEQLKVLLIVETENTEPLWHINFTHTRYRKSFAYLGEHVFFINEHIYVRLNYPLINTEAAYSFDGEICDVAESPGDDPNFLAVLAAGHALLVMVYYEGRVVPITRLNVVLPNAAMVFWTIHEIILVGEPTRYGMLEFHTYDSSFYSAQHEMDWQERYIPVAGGVHYTLLGVKKTPKRPGLVVVSNDSAGNYCICVIDLELRSSTLQFVETAGPVHLVKIAVDLRDFGNNRVVYFPVCRQSTSRGTGRIERKTARCASENPKAAFPSHWQCHGYPRIWRRFSCALRPRTDGRAKSAIPDKA